jgi:hypothetical protein
VELPQKVIFINDVWAGYVGNDPRAHISIILTDLPEAVLAEVKRQVDELRGSETSKIVQSKRVEDSVVPTAETKPATNSLDEVGL